ncbi:MAG: hypothetical protein SGI97_00515 [candidate division Zixibacteria bacterium]|nr:hypothetical protein [candidate division Zixibacteria bacterium]
MNRVTLALLTCLLLTSGGSANQLDTAERLSLDLNKVSLTSVIAMLADQYKLNIVISGALEGEVSLRLDSVSLATALDAILSSNGYRYYINDDVIIISDGESTSTNELVSRVIRLNYLEPEAAQKALLPRLSGRGSVVILSQQAEETAADVSRFTSNRIVITDYATVIDGLSGFIDDMDRPERTVLIECKIIETKLDSNDKLGFIWPSQTSATISGAGSSASSGGTTTVGKSAAEYDLESESWTWGKLSVGQVSLVLDFLKQNGKSKLISNPRITATENHESEIKVSTIIPIQTLNRFSEGAVIQDIVSFQDQEVGISLKVTPRINEEGKITLDVFPQIEDIIGFTGPANNQRPITASRSIRTRITVNDGESVALGGLLKEDDIKRVSRVPLLGHIPILGRLLFTNTSTEKSTTDLIILITPRIVQ